MAISDTQYLDESVSGGGSLTVPTGEIWEVEAISLWASGTTAKVEILDPTGTKLTEFGQTDSTGNTVRQWLNGVKFTEGWTIREKYGNSPVEMTLRGKRYL